MKKLFLLKVLSLISVLVFAQYPPSYEAALVEKATLDSFTRIYLAPQRIVWKTGEVSNENVLLNKEIIQPYFGNKNVMCLANKNDQQAGILLDFGKEIHGGIRITTSQANNRVPRVRIRFGESVSEANGESFNVHRGRDGSTNHHAVRDFEQIPVSFNSL